MRKLRITVLVIAGLLLVIVPSIGWYTRHYSMSVAKEFEVGDASLSPRVLIATQGSAYKDALVDGIVKHLKTRPAYVKVVDVSALPQVHDDDWNAIVVIHTWERWKPQPDAKAFVARIKDKKKLIVVTTSGSGEEAMPGVDAISGASVLKDVPTQVGRITARLDALLGK